jgi:hypothetical protein
MKQSTEHNQEFSVSRKLSLKKIGPLIFELSGLKQRTKRTDKIILNCQMSSILRRQQQLSREFI